MFFFVKAIWDTIGHKYHMLQCCVQTSIKPEIKQTILPDTVVVVHNIDLFGKYWFTVVLMPVMIRVFFLFLEP